MMRSSDEVFRYEVKPVEDKAGMIEVAGWIPFWHEYRDDPHDDEVITVCRSEKVTDRLLSEMEKVLRRKIEEHRAGDIR